MELQSGACWQTPGLTAMYSSTFGSACSTAHKGTDENCWFPKFYQQHSQSEHVCSTESATGWTKLTRDVPPLTSAHDLWNQNSCLPSKLHASWFQHFCHLDDAVPGSDFSQSSLRGLPVLHLLTSLASNGCAAGGIRLHAGPARHLCQVPRLPQHINLANH
jgi:hypothetical protein